MADEKSILVKIQADITDLQSKLNQAGESLEKTEKEAEKSGKGLAYLQEKATLAAGAITAAGAGAILLIERSKQLDAQLNKTSLTSGIAADELRAMTMRLSDASTTTDEAAAALDALSRAGVKNAEDMEKSSTAFLKLADATEESADSLIYGLTPAFKAYNIQMADAEDHIDTVNYLIRNTTYNSGDLANSFEKLGPKLSALNLTFEDTAVILKIMSDRGIDGKQAISLIDEAIQAANPDLAEYAEKAATAGENNKKLGTDIEFAERKLGIMEERYKTAKEPTEEMSLAIDMQKQKISDLKAQVEENNTAIDGYKTAQEGAKDSTTNLYTALGITTPELDKYSKSMDDAAGMTEKYAQKANEAKGPTDELKSSVDKLSLSIGKSLNPFESFLSLTTTLAGAFMGLNLAVTILGATVVSLAGVYAVLLGVEILVSNALADQLEKLGAAKESVEGLRGSWLAFLTPLGLGLWTLQQINSAIDTFNTKQLRPEVVAGFTAGSANGGIVGGVVGAVVGGIVGASTPAAPVMHYSGRASGGPVSAGTPYIVGEQGQELFVPSTNGTIIPNGALGGSGRLEALLESILRELQRSGDVYLDGDKVGESVVRRIVGDRGYGI